MFTDFIKKPKDFLNNYRVVAVQKPVYSPIFFRALFEKIKREVGLTLAVIDASSQEIGQIQLRLSTSFLGQSCLFWFGDTSLLPAKTSAELMKFLANYQGEHQVLVFVPQEISGPSCVTVTCPEKIDKKLFNELVVLYDHAEQARCKTITNIIFKKLDILTLEQAVCVLEYARVLGANREIFCQQWLEHIVKPESSLFRLAGLLLARDENFWLLWARVSVEYEFPFWLAYFSELFFRAHFYCAYREQQKLTEAKKISYRLPFSFIQKDWQKIDRERLCVAHDVLNTVDYNLKNGASVGSLDTIFTRFFT